jgi:hypothetical protein
MDVVREHLRTYPQYHDQYDFVCGTNGCVAGWTVALELGAQAGDNLREIIKPMMNNEKIEQYAKELLGLSSLEMRALFYDNISPFTRKTPEETALELLDALISREKNELSTCDIIVLENYNLPTEPRKRENYNG